MLVLPVRGKDASTPESGGRGGSNSEKNHELRTGSGAGSVSIFNPSIARQRIICDGGRRRQPTEADAFPSHAEFGQGWGVSDALPCTESRGEKNKKGGNARKKRLLNLGHSNTTRPLKGRKSSQSRQVKKDRARHHGRKRGGVYIEAPFKKPTDPGTHHHLGKTKTHGTILKDSLIGQEP